MLDNQHQIDAYKLLQASPIKTASSILQATDVESKAKAKGTSLGGLILATVTYPASITAQVTKLTSWAALLNRASTVCGTFKTNVTPYQTPTEMIELYVGWDVYLKVSGLPADSLLRTNAAVADTTLVAALQTAVNGMTFTDVFTAWNAVNAALTIAPVTDPQAPPIPAPTLTQAQIDALTTAMSAAEPTFTALTGQVNSVETLATNAKSDADKASDAFHRAVDVSVMTNIASSPVLADSLKAIVTPEIYQALAAVSTDA